MRSLAGFAPVGGYGFHPYYVTATCILLPSGTTITIGMPRRLELLKRSYPHDNGWIDIKCAFDGKLADLQVHTSDLEGRTEAWFMGFLERAADSLIQTSEDYSHSA